MIHQVDIVADLYWGDQGTGKVTSYLYKNRIRFCL